MKQQRIREAEGEAEALLTVQKAQADAIRMINEANPNHNYLALRSMEAMEKVADGKATKLIVPSDMQNLAATVFRHQGDFRRSDRIKFSILFFLPAVFCRGQFLL